MTDEVLEKSRPLLSGRVKIVLIDVDEKPDLARHYGISSIPRVFLFQQGKIVASHGGFGDPAQVQDWVKRSLD
jgi:thioredoxin-like negative regulator of GroEL